MVMEKARPHLDALSQLAPELNRATDLYTAELKEIEEQLNKLKLGIEIELDAWIQKGNSYTKEDERGEPLGVFHSAWTLGYGKYGRAWCLVVREYEVWTGNNEHTQESIVPLLEASRELRLAAAENIPGLLKEIEVQVKKKIETLAKVSDKH